jgi:DNA-binding CsgD family transcriptional regulator
MITVTKRTPPEPELLAGEQIPTPRTSSFNLDHEVLAVVSVPLTDPSSLAQLTPVERSVASLAATGLSNAEIGARRGTSERTVANQMASILRKMKLTSRYHLAARLALCDLTRERP